MINLQVLYVVLDFRKRAVSHPIESTHDDSSLIALLVLLWNFYWSNMSTTEFADEEMFGVRNVAKKQKAHSKKDDELM